MSASCSTAQDRFLEFDGDQLAQNGGKGKLIPAAGARAEISRRSAYFYQRTNARTDPSDDTQSAGCFVIFGTSPIRHHSNQPLVERLHDDRGSAGTLEADLRAERYGGTRAVVDGREGRDGGVRLSLYPVEPQVLLVPDRGIEPES